MAGKSWGLFVPALLLGSTLYLVISDPRAFNDGAGLILTVVVSYLLLSVLPSRRRVEVTGRTEVGLRPQSAIGQEITLLLDRVEALRNVGRKAEVIASYDEAIRLLRARREEEALVTAGLQLPPKSATDTI